MRLVVEVGDLTVGLPFRSAATITGVPCSSVPLTTSTSLPLQAVIAREDVERDERRRRVPGAGSPPHRARPAPRGSSSCPSTWRPMIRASFGAAWRGARLRSARTASSCEAASRRGRDARRPWTGADRARRRDGAAWPSAALARDGREVGSARRANGGARRGCGRRRRVRRGPEPSDRAARHCGAAWLATGAAAAHDARLGRGTGGSRRTAARRANVSPLCARRRTADRRRPRPTAGAVRGAAAAGSARPTAAPDGAAAAAGVGADARRRRRCGRAQAPARARRRRGSGGRSRPRAGRNEGGST